MAGQLDLENGIVDGVQEVFSDEEVTRRHYGYTVRQWSTLTVPQRAELVRLYSKSLQVILNTVADKPLIPGVGPDAPIVTNEHGASQSSSPYRCDLLPPLAVLKIAEVLKHGAEKYAPNNWRKISSFDHLNHVLVHLLAHMAGDSSDDHTGHALCRMAMFYEAVEAEKKGEIGKGVMPP